jgi:hypothetical protein
MADTHEEKDSPADVARDGFNALMNGEGKVVSHSARSRLQARLSGSMPDSLRDTHAH